jgi:cardiolipin synthase
VSLKRTEESTGDTVDVPTKVMSWESVHLYHSGDEFFRAFEQAIAEAESCIQVETYIFAFDRLGQQVLDWLGAAVQRGVNVRLIVDGIGSSSWLYLVRQRTQQLGIQLKVFHELPWNRWSRGRRPSRTRLSLSRTLQRINNRNHRKVCIIDSRRALLGSMNIIECHCASLVGARAWRDTGVQVVGSQVSVLEASFNELWSRGQRALSAGRRLRKALSSGPLVRLNLRRAQRKENYLDLLIRILGAERRIWIQNAYFVPDGSLVRALRTAAEGGVDVRIVVPAVSDVFFIPWVTSAFHAGLLRAGVRIFEYTQGMMHAKTMLIDDWGLVGSSNLNHRSLFHDLEADVVLGSVDAGHSLEEQFQQDCLRSREVTLHTWRERSWIERMLGRMLLWMRWVL